MTLNTMTLGLTTFSIMMIFVTQYNGHLVSMTFRITALYQYADCSYAEFHI
jgi:hypothetical protein